MPIDFLLRNTDAQCLGKNAAHCSVCTEHIAPNLFQHLTDRLLDLILFSQHSVCPKILTLQAAGKIMEWAVRENRSPRNAHWHCWGLTLPSGNFNGANMTPWRSPCYCIAKTANISQKNGSMHAIFFFSFNMQYVSVKVFICKILLFVKHRHIPFLSSPKCKVPLNFCAVACSTCQLTS